MPCFAQRNFGLNRILDLIRKSGGHVRRNESRRHGVHSDVTTRQFTRERFGETDQACFACSVVCLPGIAHEADHRGDVNDAPAALFDHRALCGLHEVERSSEVRVDDHVPILDRHPHAQPVALHTSVVN